MKLIVLGEDQRSVEVDTFRYIKYIVRIVLGGLGEGIGRAKTK